MVRPRLAIATPSVDPDAGGVARFSHLVANIAEEDGWDVHLVDPGPSSSRLVRLGFTPVLASKSLLRQCRRMKPDLVVTNGWLGATFRGRFPRVHVFHGTMPGRWHTFGPAESLRYRLRLTVGLGIGEMAAGRGAYRIAVSSGVAAEVQRWFRCNVDEVIDNAVDTSLFRHLPSNEARRKLGLSPVLQYALLAGNTERLKGSHLLSAACQLAGWTPVTAGGQVAGVRWLGRLDGERLVLAYNSADAVVFPSLYEAASLGLLEALACGATVLMSEVGTVPMLIGRLPELRDCVIDPSVEGLAAGLRRVAEDPNHYRQIAARAQNLVRREFDLTSFGTRWRDVLRRCASADVGLPPARQSGGLAERNP